MNKKISILLFTLAVIAYNCLFFGALKWKNMRNSELLQIYAIRSHVNCGDNDPCVNLCCDGKECPDANFMVASEINSTWDSDYKFRIVKGRPCKKMYIADQLYELDNVS